MPKVLASFLLVFLFLWQFQWVVSLYASEQSVLNSQKDSSVATLDAIEDIIDNSVEKLDDKIKSKKISDQLQNKHDEIWEYLDQITEEIKQENSAEDIKEIVEEAKKVVVLKVVSGVTSSEDTLDNIPNDVASTQAEKKEAGKVLKDSFETESWDYTILIRTKYDEEKVRKTFGIFDENIEISFMYEVWGENYFQITIQENSIFRTEMMEDIDSGVLPSSFLGIKIVLPEVFSLFSADISGEDLSQTWGITDYATYNYFPELEWVTETIQVWVVDTGIDYTHPDLSWRVNTSLGKDFVNEDDDAWDDQGHGTHVAGTIAASVNGSGILWVNPYVELVPLKICSESGFCPSYAVISALDYASTHNIDILNMSLWGRGNPSEHAICDAISSVVAGGWIVIAASWNANIDTSEFVPGWCSEAITVGAYDAQWNRAAFSNYGSKVDVSAPGVDVYSTYPTNKWNYKQLSGTSMAAPHIAWVASIVQAYRPNITTSELRAIFSNSARTLSVDKPIASAVDISAMMLSLNWEQVQQEVVEVEENIEESTESQIAGTGAIKKDTHFDDNEDWVRESISTQPQSQILDIWDLQEIIEVNSWEWNYETLDISEEQEEQKVFVKPQAEKIFDEQGNLLEDGASIQSDEDFISATLTQWPVSLENIPKNIFNTPEEENDDISLEAQELFIDGAERWVEINTTWGDLGFIEFEEEGGISEDRIIEVDEGYIEQNLVSDTEQINLDNFTLVQKSEIQELSYQLPDTEVYIDWASEWIWINNISNADWKIIEVHDYIKDDYPIVNGWEIPTPYEFLWEDEDDEYIWDLPEYIGETNETWISIQATTKECIILKWQSCEISIYKPYRFSHTVEDSNIAYRSKWEKRSITIVWQNLWSTVYKIYNGSNLYYVINITVEEVPIPQEYDMVVEKTRITKLYFPEQNSATFSAEYLDSWRASLTNYPWSIFVEWEEEWHINYYIKWPRGYLRYIVHATIIPKQPEVIKYNIYTGDYIFHNLISADKFSFAVDSDIWDDYELLKSHYWVWFRSYEVGEVNVLMTRTTWAWETKYLLKFFVHAQPEVFDVTIESGATEEINIINDKEYTFEAVSWATTFVDIEYLESTWLVRLTGGEAWTKSWNVLSDTWAIKYKINTTVLPSYEIYETEKINIRLAREHPWEIISSVQWIVEIFSDNSSYISVIWENVWKSLVTVINRYNTIYVSKYYINVIPKPVLTEYNLDLLVFQDGEVTLPEDISSYTFTRSWDSIFTDSDWDDSLSILNDRTFSFTAEKSWEAVLYLKDSHNFPIYIINVSSKVQEVDYTIIQSESRDPGLSSSHYHTSDDYNIAYVHNSDEVYGNNPGITSIHTTDRDYVHFRTTHVTVVPIPDPVEIICNMYAGETCTTTWVHDGITYTTSRSDAFEIDYGNSTIRAKWLAVGTATVYIKSRYGDYIRAIMRVTVLPEPPQVYECETPVGTDCQTLWYDNVGTYTITSTDTSIVNASLYRYSNTNFDPARNYERTVITWVSEWYAEVYIYENQDHKFTVQMTVTPPVPPITVEDGSVTLLQWESIEIDILSGGWEYRVVEFEDDIIYFDTDNPSGWTANVDIVGRNPGKTYPIFRDKYFQEFTMSVNIEDATLELSTDAIQMTGSDQEYITVSDYYGDVQVSASNSNVRVTKEPLDDGRIAFLITPLAGWETTLTFTDNEPGSPNTKTAVVTVWGGGWGETPVEEEWSFEDISYQEKSSEEWVNTITFKLEWSLFEEVGIMYLKNDQIYKQSLQEGSNWWYSITCIECPERSVPYILSENTYKKASVEYYEFNQNTYEISSIDSGIEINAIIFAWNDFYQVWKPNNILNAPIAYQYLEWIEIAMYDFLSYDIDGIYSWDKFTAIELAKISAWTRSLQSSIDAVPDIKKLWDDINLDIQSWLYAYSDNDRRYLKWYLGSSAVIEEKDWQNFNQSRVTQEINNFHQKRRIATYSFWTADSEIQEYIDLVNSIDNWLQSKIKKSGNYWVYADWLYPHLYTESSVVFLKSKNLISQAEYDVLIKYQTQLKYLYVEAIKEHILTETQAWISEWRDQALEDYIVESLLLFNPFEFAEIISWLSELELSDITEGFELLVDIYNNREEIFAWLSEYDQAYYTAYIKTTLAMAGVPVKLNKVNKLKENDRSEAYTEIISLLKIYQAKKVLQDVSSISQKIGWWHAYNKHIDKFRQFWIETVEELQSNTEMIIRTSNATNNMKHLERGRIGYWNDSQNSLVIFDPNSLDKGTTFIPDTWKIYFNNLQ